MSNAATQRRIAWSWGPASRSWTWKKIVAASLAAYGGTASLAQLYSIIEPHPGTRTRKHWKAKIRQVLELSDKVIRMDRGVWSLASKHKAKTIRKLKARRRRLYPKRSEAER